MNMPMIADCTDYEVARTGAYAPGIIGTIFSFVDKVVSSLSTTIVGFLLAGIGYTSTLPHDHVSLLCDHSDRRMGDQCDRAPFLQPFT